MHIVLARPFRTDDAGRLGIPNLEPGRYTLHVGGREAASFEMGKEPLERRIRLRE